jgi:hypothetical protein
MPISYVAVAPQEIRWSGQETVRELGGQPHLLLRLDVTGSLFPHRNAPAFLRIVRSAREGIVSWIAEVSPDGRTLSGYFGVDDATKGMIEYGYGQTILGRLERPFDATEVKRLDRARLPRETVIVTTEYLKGRR